MKVSINLKLYHLLFQENRLQIIKDWTVAYEAKIESKNLQACKIMNIA